ncbi:MAG: 50S ribosomal protein L21 [Bifidobacteriaceae bacterium]|nr:50S ribosomal protein L21 [Bifidobacteriaceae bacterium]
MYAIIKASGRQEKVSVGDVVVVNRLDAKVGQSVEFPAVLVVDQDKVTTAASDLEKVKVTAEVLGEERGTKIRVFKYKNKTGYRRHQGHRQELSRVKVTAIK